MEVILYLSFCCGLFPIIFYLASRKHPLSRDIHFITPFLWLTAITTLCEPLLSNYSDISPRSWFRVYYLLEFLSLYYFFFKLMRGAYKFLLYLFLLLFIAGNLYLSIAADKSTANTEYYYSSFMLLFVFSFALLWPMHTLANGSMPLREGRPSFWFVIGLLFYHSCLFALFLLKVLMNIDQYQLPLLTKIIFELILLISIWRARLD